MRTVLNRRGLRGGLAAAAIAALTGCTTVGHVQNNPDEFPVVTGPAVADNKTVFHDAFVCVRDRIRAKTDRRVAVTVGNVKDYTGKFSESEGGSVITQGGALMVISRPAMSVTRRPAARASVSSTPARSIFRTRPRSMDLS